MATHDYVIANGTGAAVRSDINGALAAIVSQNSSASEPSPTYAYMRWADTTAGVMKMRNGANSAWIPLYELDGTFLASDISLAAGSAAAPSLFFTGDTNTGLFSPGADTVALATAGQNRLHISSGGLVGIGTTGPAAALHSRTDNAGSGSTPLLIQNRSVSSNTAVGISFAPNTSDTADRSAIIYGVNSSGGVGNGTDLAFYTNPNGGSPTEKARIDSSGNIAIGTSSTSGARLFVTGGALTSSVAGGLAIAGSLSTGRLTSDSSNINSIHTYLDNSTIEIAPGSTYKNGISINGNSTSTDTSTIKFFTGNSERARIDTSGRLLVGTTIARANFYNSSNTSRLQVEGTTSDTGFSRISAVFNDNSANGDSIIIGKTRGSTAGSATAVISQDNIGYLSFQAADGTELVEAASIGAAVDGTPGANDMPGRLVFSTTADGAASPTERMTLFSNGFVKIGNTSSAYVYPGIDNSLYLGSPSFRWNLVYSVNGTASSSDEREKTEISDASLGIDFVKSLRPVSYKWKIGHNDVETNDEGDVTVPRPGLRTHWGFLAQEVKQSADDAGVDFGGWILTDTDDPESSQGLRYQQFIAPLTKALQEAIAKIEALEADVAALKGA